MMNHITHYLLAKFNCKKGLGTVEIVLIAFVLISLVILFREKITEIVKDMLGKIESDVKTFD